MKIGFYDSGLGGLTILIEALKNIKGHEFIYLADNLNAPYGEKDIDFLKKIIFDNINRLVNLGCKVIVIACNTATAVAVNDLRKYFKDIKIIGTEPAIKSAVNYFEDLKLNNKLNVNDKILLTATKVTLKEERLNNLINRVNKDYNIEKMDLQELVKFAENLEYTNKEIYDYLNYKIKNKESYKAMVLGCTHFPLFKEYINSFFEGKVKIFDSSYGVVKNLMNYINEDEYSINDLDIYNLNVNNNVVKLIMTNENENYFNKFKTIILKNV